MKKQLLLCASDSAPLCAAERHGRHSEVSSLEDGDNEHVIARGLKTQKKKRKKIQLERLSRRTKSRLLFIISFRKFSESRVLGKRISADTERGVWDNVTTAHTAATCLGGKEEDNSKCHRFTQ